MNEVDLIVTANIINRYGIFDVKKHIELNEQMLTYIYNTRFKDCIFERDKSFLYNEADNIIFTNEKTSVFCINKKLVSLDLLTKNKIVRLSKSLMVSVEEIEKYFNISKDLFGKNSIPTTLVNNNEFIFNKGINSNIDSIPINEYRLIKLLLENARIYLSTENPIIYAESDNGYAYVLGKNNGKQLRF